MRIGVLGGVFNPPHKDHIRIVEAAKRQLGLERVIIIPCKMPPHKELPKVSPRLRWQMARLAVGRRKGWMVSDLEFYRRGISYTENTIRALKKQCPHDKIFWIIGADSLIFMPRDWKGGYKILDSCQFVVAPRKDFLLNRVPPHILKKTMRLHMHPTAISSTAVRNLISCGKNPKPFLSPGVAEFIKKHKLYL